MLNSCASNIEYFIKEIPNILGVPPWVLKYTLVQIEVHIIIYKVFKYKRLII